LRNTILGIESTAHTFSVGIYDTQKKLIIANAKNMFQPEHGWGIDPNKAREHHNVVKDKILENALKEAGISMEDIDTIAYAAGPGLPPCLQVGHRFAVTLSEKYKIKLIPVNHCIAHIEVGKFLTGAKDPITLYVSGGNTQVLGYSDRYRCFGETLDKAVGSAIDTFIRKTDGRSPGGPIMEKLATGKYIELPYVVKGMDISVSGLLTAAIEKAKTHKLEDVCFIFQETIYAMLTEISERAMAHTGKRTAVNRWCGCFATIAGNVENYVQGKGS
jgi:glycoprotease/Kae1 family metallohydrolase